MAVEQIQNLPQQYVTDLGVDYGKQLAGLTSIPLDTSKLAPQVAGQDALQTQAYNLAQSGVGSFQPFLTQAGAYSGPQGYQSFMSPYQQDIIDATLADFDKQAAMDRTKTMQDAGRGTVGNLDAGRFGVQLAEQGAQSNLDRAALLATLRQDGFNTAQNLANRAFGQQRNLASDTQTAQTADINQLGRLGGVQQLQAQALLDAQQEANRLEAFEPYERLGTYGSGVASLFSGNAPFGQQSTITPNATPLQTALGTASVLSGIFGGAGPRDVGNVIKNI
jgi:hypothetical protein